MDYLLYITEQHVRKPLTEIPAGIRALLTAPAYQRIFHYNQEMFCYRLYNDNQTFTVDTNFFVGVDWLVPEQAAVFVEPKLNNGGQINFLGMLLESLVTPENFDHLHGIYDVDYNSPWIKIPEQKDLLSPLLIVQFLTLLQRIVRKGLKKSYYRITKNLNSRIKGKIIVGKQVKENILKNQLTKTICSYQEFGVNSAENQFLKLALEFVSSYINQQQQFFDKIQQQQLSHTLHYCLPSFAEVDTWNQKHVIPNVTKNIFYKEYGEAIKLASYILKRFSFNINNTSASQTSTPPFWIDMSKLFELYVVGKLKKVFKAPGMISYHDNFIGGKQTDILLHEENNKCVIDCKYKPIYENKSPSLADKRQLAGYTRLKSVYNKLQIPIDKLIKGLIIYSHQDCEKDIKKENLFSTPIEEYVNFYKLGISLPEIAIR